MSSTEPHREVITNTQLVRTLCRPPWFGREDRRREISRARSKAGLRRSAPERGGHRARSRAARRSTVRTQGAGRLIDCEYGEQTPEPHHFPAAAAATCASI